MKEEESQGEWGNWSVWGSKIPEFVELGRLKLVLSSSLFIRHPAPPTTAVSLLFPANHADTKMDEPLLPYLSPRKSRPSPLFPLPEEDEVALPLTPSEFKDRLIFGPSSSSPATLLLFSSTP
ncbi:hypothetical protein CK203_018226 [Vitis vinifera]|uniref:Uncharacterized protein n=1 Tax=Vitis vinifera TaxID=29760 RepID=A0A438JP07_VITVI|nr:hypothetical protein CK203_018226 [Vitis vinifera]